MNVKIGVHSQKYRLLTCRKVSTKNLLVIVEMATILCVIFDM